MSVEFTLEHESGSITLPINPANFRVTRAGNNEETEIIGATNIVIARRPGLRKGSLASFFPRTVTVAETVSALFSNFSTFTSIVPSNTTISSFAGLANSTTSSGTPMSYVDFIVNAWNTNPPKPLKLTVTNIDMESFEILIDNFSWEIRGGEHEDVYFQLDFIEYIHYGAIEINENLDDTATVEPLAENRAAIDKAKINSTYTTGENDSIATITKKLTGNTSRWEELYNINAATLSQNPANIFTNTTLSIPKDWQK